MVISPQDLIAIGTTVTLGVQIAKKALPGDYDAWGVEITGLVSLVAVACWLAQSPGSLGSRDSFDILTLWLTVYGIATGVYKTSTMVTATPTPPTNDPPVVPDAPPRFLQQAHPMRPRPSVKDAA